MDWIKKFLFVPIWMICIYTILSAISLTYIFIKGLEMSFIAYVVYVFSFYSFVILCIFCFIRFPKYYKKFKNKIYTNQYTNRYLTDVVYKTQINLYRSLSINLGYVLINLVSAYLYKTRWFIIFASYYAILAIMRFLLLRYVRKNGMGINYLGELKRARLCAILLLTVNFVLIGAVLMMVYLQRGFKYQGVLIYVIALYTFYITIAAIVDLVKYRKYKSPIMSASTMIKLAASLVSMLTLETAMLSQFGAETSNQTKMILIVATSIGVVITIIGLASYFIVKTTKEIQNIRRSNGK